MEKSGMSGRAWTLLVVASLIVGVFLLSSSFTGRAIADTGGASWVGTVLLVLGLFGIFSYYRNRDR